MTEGPGLKAIGRAQNEARNLTRQLAARRYYADAKFLHFMGSTISVVFALAAPFFVWRWPESGPQLGAAAGGWIFLSRLVLIPLRDRRRLNGALAQEMFDCDVLGLPWNRALPEPLAPEDIHGTASRAKKRTKKKGKRNWNVGDWYPADADAPWPQSALICQRSNAVWARRQHGGYGWFLVVIAAGWGVAGIVFGVVNELSLAAYLTTILLPSLPALLDASEEARAHFGASSARQHLEAATGEDISKESPDPSRVRAIQDQMFSLRRKAPLVPEWFYKVRREQLEADMRDAAQDLTSS